jgi:hypothetical protein
MRPWMRIFLRIFLFILSVNSFAVCQFRPDVKKVISLSGTTTVLLKHLNLLKDKKLQGISVFNPIGPHEFSGTVYPGGIFLSKALLEELRNGIVIFDESRELKKILSAERNITSYEMVTRGQTPDESIATGLKSLKNILANCEEEFEVIDVKAQKLQAEILKKIPPSFSAIFYLGEFSRGRRPEMVIVQDGFVKWLIQQKKLITYPSELAYINWSAKILNALPESTKHVAIKDSGRENIRQIKKSPLGVTLIYPGALVPGLSQLEAFHFLFNEL